MNLLYRLSILCLLPVALTACANAATSDSTPDPDSIKLTAMSKQAMQIAQKESSDVVLRQVDTDLTITDFRFVDSALTQEIMVVVPEPDAPIDKWHTVVSSVSPLLTYAEPALNLQSLRVGPSRVAQSMTARWPGCIIRGITLYRENDRLTWVAFCNTPEGVASGSIPEDLHSTGLLPDQREV